MGAVYSATQTSLDRPVAIKILPKVFSNDPQFQATFESEAKAMARLSHSNLIAVFDFGEADGMLYIVMELVDGKSLHDSCRGESIEQKEAGRLVSEICRGLAHAHKAGIIHRDIKPGNILLTSSAEPKIGDFGLAHPLGESVLNEGGYIWGTPGYSAPEVVDNPDGVDQRTDIFAVGILLFELLTGGIPAT
ncbi:serine/threonine protein kinase, partial [Verrucomicrobiales bacterium]|nr:serine/threonine protein kinase [Verrucomicrobiales bacterium]